MPYAGAAYVFARSGTTWSQEAYLKPSNPDANDWFGAGGLGLSGNTIVVGSTGEASTATGVNGNQADNSCKGVGAAYVFVKSGGSWSQQAYLKASYNANHGVAALFGGDAAIQGDTILIGAAGEKSAATGIGGEQGDETRDQSGAAYVFTRSAGVWTQASYMKASNTDAGDAFGLHVAISGETIVISAAGEASAAGGTDIDPSDNSAPDAGAVYVIR